MRAAGVRVDRRADRQSACSGRATPPTMSGVALKLPRIGGAAVAPALRIWPVQLGEHLARRAGPFAAAGQRDAEPGVGRGRAPRDAERCEVGAGDLVQRRGTSSWRDRRRRSAIRRRARPAPVRTRPPRRRRQPAATPRREGAVAGRLLPDKAPPSTREPGCAGRHRRAVMRSRSGAARSGTRRAGATRLRSRTR